MGGTIVCDVTDPLAGRNAAEFAGALGARLELRVVLVHVGIEAERCLETLARGVARDAETRVAVGDHAEALARVAAEEGADLVVGGARPAGLGGRKLRWRLARGLGAATPPPGGGAAPPPRERSHRPLPGTPPPHTTVGSL